MSLTTNKEIGLKTEYPMQIEVNRVVLIFETLLTTAHGKKCVSRTELSADSSSKFHMSPVLRSFHPNIVFFLFCFLLAGFVFIG